MEPLIFDRTREDADYAFENQHEPALKGAYNAVDLNRVGSWLNHLAATFNEYGYAITINLKTTWTEEDMPRKETDWFEYFDAVKRLRGVITPLATTPQAPVGVQELFAAMGWHRANDIEKILFDISNLIEWMTAAFRHSGTFNSGMEGIRV